MSPAEQSRLGKKYQKCKCYGSICPPPRSFINTRRWCKLVLPTIFAAVQGIEVFKIVALISDKGFFQSIITVRAVYRLWREVELKTVNCAIKTPIVLTLGKKNMLSK